MDRETDSWHGGSGRLARVAFAAVMVVSVLALAPGTTAAQSNASSASDATFIVQQGSQCTQVTPVGNGTESAWSFYDYRSPLTDPDGYYSSYGTRDLQEIGTSQVFVYRGSDGLSLVFINGKFGDGGGGFVVSADVSGLPTDGSWPVEDDNYNAQDDVFETNESDGSAASIEWFSNGNRTDGAVFTGLESPNYETVSVDMSFNEGTGNFPYEKWKGEPSDNRITDWVVRSGDGSTTELDMNQSIDISPGTCSGGVSTFTPTATPTTGATGATGTAGTSAATSAPTAAATETTAATATATSTATRTQTATRTATTTATATAAATPTAVAAETDAAAGNASGNGSSNGGSNSSGSGSGGGSGAFGPGFGVVVAALAVALLGIGLARRRR